jgi:hypothetical protein
MDLLCNCLLLIVQLTYYKGYTMLPSVRNCTLSLYYLLESFSVFRRKIEDISLEKMFGPRGDKLTSAKEESLKSVPFLYFL